MMHNLASDSIRARSLPQTGAHLGVYLPSDALTPTRRARYEKGIQILRAHDFRISEPSNLRSNDGYSAGDPTCRRIALEEMAANETIDGFIMGWGGKSCIDLLPGLDFGLLSRKGRPWLAASDGCVLVNAITLETGLITFYGPNGVGKLDQTKHADLGILREGPDAQLSVFGDEAPNLWRSVNEREAVGRVFGGDLSTFTPFLLRAFNASWPSDVVLFLESQEADPRVTCQLLSALAQSPFFRHVRGVVMGDLNLQPTAADYVLLHLKDVGRGRAIFHCPTFGHGVFENSIIPIGVSIELQPNKAPTVNRRCILI